MAAAAASNHSPSGRRTLAALAFVDIVGYSILMATDEAGTHARWMEVLGTILRPKARQHSGKIVKSTGDGVLAMFSSVLDAVEWAQDVQSSVAAEDAAPKNKSPQLLLRIAVHLSDVIETDDDIYGDGVNVAARLQEHAKPGGIALSEAVYDLVRGTAGAKAIDLGVRNLKNFQKPVRIYSLEPSATKIATPALSSSDRLPSIAIMPLQNLGSGNADDYFGDGVVEDIVSSLARLGELFVVSRGSTLIYRGRQTDPRDVGKALGVRYVLQGSIRISPQLIRVTTQLCDTDRGANLWSDTTEVAPSDLFAEQDRIVERIVAGIAPNVRAAELRGALRKRPESFTAYDNTLRALYVINALDENTFGQAREMLARSIEEDPFFSMPLAWMAWWHILNVGQGWSNNPDDDIARAGALASRAIEIDQENSLALSIYGHVKSFLFHQYDTAMSYLEKAIATCPNSNWAWLLSSATLAYMGRGEQAVRHAEHGLRLSPLDRTLYFTYNILCIAHYVNGTYDEAAKWGRLSKNENPAFSANHRILIASLAAAGQFEEARATAAELLQLEPGFRLSVWQPRRQPFRDPETRRRQIEQLRSSGLPD